MEIDYLLNTIGISDPQIAQYLEMLIPKLELKKGSKALLIGPGTTPLQYVIAGSGVSVDVVEISEKARAEIKENAKRAGLERMFRVYDGADADIAKVALEPDSYDFLTALNVLDLVGERREIYEKMLVATRHLGKIAIGHYDLGIGTREQNNLNTHAGSMQYGLEDLRIVVDEGHPRNAHWFTEDSTVFRLHKREIPQRARGKVVYGVSETLKLFGSLLR